MQQSYGSPIRALKSIALPSSSRRLFTAQSYNCSCVHYFVIRIIVSPSPAIGTSPVVRRITEMSSSQQHDPSVGLDQALILSRRKAEQQRRRGNVPRPCPICNKELPPGSRQALERHFSQSHPLKNNDEAEKSERTTLIDNLFARYLVTFQAPGNRRG